MDKRKALIASIITLAVILVFGIVLGATDTNLGSALGLIPEKNYAIDVIDDGESGNDVPGDDNIEVRTVVMNPDQVTTEMTLETRITNKKEQKNKQVAIVIDTSYSMDVNAEGYDVKTMAKDLVSKLADEVPSLSISVSDCSARKTNMLSVTGATGAKNTASINSINSAINSVTGGYDLSDALTYAKQTLSPSDTTEAYVVIFSDATDNVDFSVFSNSQMEENQKITVYSILAGITSTAFGTPEQPATDGKVYLFDDYSSNDKKQEIADDFNKVMRNANTTIKFNEDILRTATRGNFKLEIIDDNTDGTATQNSDGTISWTVNDTLKTAQTWKLQYKLKLNTVSTIASDVFYSDINVIKEINTKYIPYNRNVENRVTSENVRPTVQICDAYDLKIKAVGEGTTAPVVGAKFNVIGIDEDGNALVTKSGLVTDEDGMIEVDSIKYKGKVNFTVIPDIENLLGYEETDPISVLIDNQYSEDGGWLSISYDGELDASEQNLYGNGERYATIIVPIKLQTFKITLDVFDMTDPDGKLPDIDFRLIQPKLNNRYEMDALYGTTNRNGKIEFEASIMSQAGTYDYLLSQMSDKTGYENFGNATIKITFDDYGKVVEDGVEVRYNSNIEGIKNSDSEVLLKIKEKCTSASKFGMQINLTNENDQNEKVEGAIYEIQVTKIDDSNSTNEVMSYTKATDANGIINLSSVATETGFTKIDIHQVSTNNAYILETNDKQVIINRQNGIIYDITVGGQFAKKNPENNNAIIVNLTNKKKNELNVVRVHLTEKEDRTMNLINVPMQMINKDDESDIYTAVTDVDGYANFVLKDPQNIQNGTYHYEVILEQVPAGYFEPDVIGTIKLSIMGGKIAEIEDETGSGNYKPIFEPYTDTEVTNREIKYLGATDYLLTGDASSTSYLQIHLTDKDDGRNIQYGKYEVTMERNGAPIANAGSVGKYTDANGLTSKMSIPGLDEEPVTITISQVFDSTRQNGYKIDPNVYTIEVNKVDGVLTVIRKTQADGSELPVGTTVTSGSSKNNNVMNMIIFNNQNVLLDPGDIILDFSVLKYDKSSGQAMQQQDLVIWSNDVEVYNPDTGDYEDFTINSAVNPMQTGITPTNLNPGQVQVKMKPKSLPAVTDPNKDGYPVASIVVHIAEYNEDPDSNGTIAGTECAVRFILTYSKTSGTYKYTGYAPDVGAAMLKDFIHSNSENSGDGYVISGLVELWSNVGEAANFAIDMSKYDSLGQELPDAKYKIKVQSPTGRFITLSQTVINGANTVEFSNVYVQEGSLITFTEEEEPIGYGKDTEEGVFRVKKVDESMGIVTLEKYGEGNSRMTLGQGRLATIDGVQRFVQDFRFEDLPKDNIEVTIKTKDKDTNEGTNGNSFKIWTNTGSSTWTGRTGGGEVKATIGGEREKDYLRYTISQTIANDTEVAKFYKRIANDIDLRIYFDENRNIVSDRLDANGYDMLNAGSAGYNDWWRITEVGERKITIEISQYREDPLNVEIKTVDKYSGATLTGQKLVNTVSYSITPTEVVGSIDGKGYAGVKVGFVYPQHTVEYKIESKLAKNYLGLQDQYFSVVYDENGNVTDAQKSLNSNAISVSPRVGTKYVDVTLTIEPAVPFVIHNVDLYYDSTKDDLNLQNAKFTIEREDHQYDDGRYRTLDSGDGTGAEGKDVLYVGNFGEGTSEGNKKYVYTVKQNTAAKKGIKDSSGSVVETQDYGKVEDFKVEVEYNSNNEIVGARLFEDTASTDRFVKSVTYKRPTVSTDWGYNGNNKGTVYIEIRNDVAFNIDFVNTDRTTDSDAANTKLLSGATYNITSSIPTSGTGKAIANDRVQSVGYVDRTLFGRTVTYEITETQPASGYQALASKIKIEVDFDSNGYVNLNSSNPVRIIEGNDYAKVATLARETDNTKSEYKNNLGIKLTLRSTPIFRITIDNVDRSAYNVGMTRDLSGAKYSITSDYNTSAQVEKTTTNTVTAMLGKTPLNGQVNYTIHEINPAQDYQTIEKDIKINVRFTPNGEIDTVTLDNGNSAYSAASKVNTIARSEDYLTVNLTIRNNPLIKLNINKMNEDSQPLSNAKFSLTGKVKGTNDVIFTQSVTTVEGLATFGIDRALDSKTIVYTLKETKNPVGYEYMGSDLTIEIVYDEVGKIAKATSGDHRITMTPVVDWAAVSATQDYEFDVNIIDEQIKELGIKLNVYDKYDNTKKAQNARIKAYLAKPGASYEEDPDHSATLISGIDENNDGTPDYGYGEDYKSIGKVLGRTGGTIVLKELAVPDSYYDTLYKQSKDNLYMSWGYYGAISCRIDLSFSDEGKMTSANVVAQPQGGNALGVCVDTRYVNATVDSNNPYLINLDVYYYPMLEMTINAKADSSYAQTANLNENELIATYNIRNRREYDPGYGYSIYNSRDEELTRGWLDAGYIGSGGNRPGIDPFYSNQGRDSKVFNTQLNAYEANHYALWPGEQMERSSGRDVANSGRERMVYVYEPGGEISEPSSNAGSAYSSYGQLQYQQHGQQDYSTSYTSYNNNLIGAIKVTYNEKGLIEKAEVVNNRGAGSRNRAENGDESQYITVNVSDNQHGIVVNIEYKRTTTFETKVVDEITRTEITDVTLYPGQGGTANTNRRYKYTTRFEQNLASGEKTWTYWGGNDANGDRRYSIGNKFNTAQTYNGYDTIGNVDVEIHYDEYGFIDINASRVLSTNAAGNPNAEITATKDKVYLTILATRRYDMRIDAKDKFDNSVTIGDAKFSITSSKTDIRSSSGYIGTVTNVSQGTRTQVGVVHPKQTVRYTISQTYAPADYMPINDIAVDVVFAENGAVDKVITSDGITLYNRYQSPEIPQLPDNMMIRVVDVTQAWPGLKPRDLNDVRFEIRNYPKIKTNVILKDKFYSDEGIPNVIYTIKDTTNNVTAAGDLTTDSSGRINTYTGTAYPQRTVRYAFTQTGTPSGYYKADSEDIVDIDYDDNGYFLDVRRVRGNSEYDWTKGGRTFTLKASNMPKDMKIGIDKDLAGVGFKIIREEVGDTSGTTKEYDVTTNEHGTILQVADTFTKRNSAIEYLYTITETQQLDGYRKVPDTKFRIRYSPDGSIDYLAPDERPDNVTIRQANGSFLPLNDGQKAHVRLRITNDNKYNLVITDEAKDVSGVKVEGTKYNVYINDNDVGSSLSSNTTSGSGTIVAPNRTEMGTIKIKVDEVSAGKGYRSNHLNSAEILIDKGVDTYSLELNQSNFASYGYVATSPTNIYDNTYKNGIEYTITLNTADNTEMILRIFEDTGNITMTFKNETMSKMNITKIDSEDSSKVLEGAEFKITAEEVNAYGGAVLDDNGDPLEPTVITESITTDINGKSQLDLGNRPVNKRIKYTFEELTAPATYLKIEKVSIIYDYDINGKIKAVESKSPRRISGNQDEWSDVNVTIKNGDVDTYSIKLVMLDSKKGSTAIGRSNTRINDVPFTITVTDEDGSRIGGTNGVQKTSRITNTFGYQEDGAILITDLKSTGKIYVTVNQQGDALEGYTKGDNQTHGTLTFENTFVPSSTGTGVEATLSDLKDGGFEDSYLDTNEAQLVIKVYNDPQITLNLHKQDIDSEEPLQGAQFTVTSEIDGKNRAATVATNLNVQTNGTDASGNEKILIGAPEYGKTVIYTLKETKIADYNQLDDIKIKVSYDTEGKISEWEILSDETYVDLKSSITVLGDQVFWDTPKTKEEQEERQRIIQEYQSLNQDEGENKKDPTVSMQGSRQMNVVVKNKLSDKTVPYTIQIKVKDELGDPIEGVEMNLALDQGIGGSPSFPIKATNAQGIVEFTANGADVLEMEATIVNAQKYTFSSNLKAIYFKNPATGYIEGRSYGDFEMKTPDNENHIIFLETTAKLQDNNFNLSIMKIDKASGTTIANNPATFTITRELKDGENVDVENPAGDTTNTTDTSDTSSTNDSTDTSTDGDTDTSTDGDTDTSTDGDTDTSTEGEDETVDLNLHNEIILGANEETSENGLITLSAIPMPEEIGTYTYNVYEVEAPDGYKRIENKMSFTITFGYTEGGGMIVVNADNSGNSGDLQVLRFAKKGVVAAVYDREEVAQDQYMLNIFKVDEETEEKINGVVFKVKLADANGTYVYTESGENADKDGQLDYCYIEQEKDYEVRLKHMRRPSVEEIRSTGSTIMVHTYQFEEIAAPEEYAVDRTPVVLKIEFQIVTDDDGNEHVEIYKNGTETSDDNLLKITDIQEDQISANFINRKQAKEFAISYKLTEDVTENVIDMPGNGIKIAEIPYSIPASKPLREGYTFDGWNTEPDGSGTTFEPGGTYAIDADLTLYAQWKTAEFVISYDGNAPIDESTGVAIGRVDNVPNNQSKAYFDDTELSTFIPKITTLGTKYRFKEWNTEPDGSGTVYNPRDTYSENESVVLYAQWDFAIKYSANYPTDENGLPMAEMENFPKLTNDELTTENPGEEIFYREYYSVNVYDNPTLNTEIPTMNGYIFKEWNTKRDGTGDRYSPGYIYRGRRTITLYAIWEYKITYDANLPKDMNGFDVEAIAQNMPDTQLEKVLAFVDKENSTIDNLYRVNVKDDDYPKISDKQPYLVPENPDVQLEEYKFVGWNTEPDGSGEYWVRSADQFDKDEDYRKNLIYKLNQGTTLYAIWDLDDDIYIRTQDYMIVDDNYTSYQGNKKEYQEGDMYVLGLEARMGEPQVISEGTNKQTFLSKIETNASVKFYKVNGDELADDEYIGTGMKAVFTRAQKTAELTLIVTGDCARSTQFDPNNAQIKDGFRYGDGWIDITDTAAVRNMINPNYKGATKETTLATDIGINNGKTDTREAVDLMVIYNNKSYNKMERGTVTQEMKGVEYYE